MKFIESPLYHPYKYATIKYVQEDLFYQLLSDWKKTIKKEYGYTMFNCWFHFVGKRDIDFIVYFSKTKEFLDFIHKFKIEDVTKELTLPNILSDHMRELAVKLERKDFMEKEYHMYIQDFQSIALKHNLQELVQHLKDEAMYYNTSVVKRWLRPYKPYSFYTHKGKLGIEVENQEKKTTLMEDVNLEQFKQYCMDWIKMNDQYNVLEGADFCVQTTIKFEHKKGE